MKNSGSDDNLEVSAAHKSALARHDLRNSLAAIKNGVYFLRYLIDPANGKGVKALNIIDAETDKTAKIIDRVFGEFDKNGNSHKTVDLSAVIDKVCEYENFSCLIAIEIEYGIETGKFKNVPDEVKRVMCGFLKTAAGLSADGKSKIRIKTEKSPSGSLIIKISIKNNSENVKEKLEEFKAEAYSADKVLKGHGCEFKFDCSGLEEIKVSVTIP